MNALRRLGSLRYRDVVLTAALALAAFAACFAGGAALAGDEVDQRASGTSPSVTALSDVAALPALRDDPVIVARERAARRRAARRARAVAARRRAAAQRAAQEAAAAPEPAPEPEPEPEPVSEPQVAAPVPVPQAAPAPQPAPTPPPEVFDDSG